MSDLFLFLWIFTFFFKVVSVVIDLLFDCSARVDYCLLTALVETGKTVALHTSVFVALAALVIFLEKNL